MVVPCYKEHDGLDEFHRGVGVRAAGRSYEIVLVNDRSTDETWNKMLEPTTAKLFYRVLEKMTDVAIPRDTGGFRLIFR